MQDGPDRKEDGACPHHATRHGLSRRGFIGSVAGFVGAAAVVGAGELPAPPGSEVAVAPGDLLPITLNVNGRTARLLVEPRWSLLDVVRDSLGLTGTKSGCERGECGACTVLIDDVPRYACMTLAIEAEGRRITTLEGLMKGESLGPVQQAFIDEDAFQCGYCTPGQILSIEGLLRQNPTPSADDVRDAVSGNLCRCGTYAHIFRAAHRAAELKREGGR